MNSSTGFLRRAVQDVKPWAETCGQIRPVLEEKDGAAAEVHHLEITDAKLHYHQRTDEIYYVLDGQGRMRLDNEEIELHKDVVVYVPRGVKHRAWGQLKVLVVCIPRGVINDVHELDLSAESNAALEQLQALDPCALASSLYLPSLHRPPPLEKNEGVSGRFET